jgi:hypothetical protein
MPSTWQNHITVNPVHILTPCPVMINMNILLPSRLPLEVFRSKYHVDKNTSYITKGMTDKMECV